VAQEPRFQIEDIERIFRALNPSGAPDPFGRIEDLILAAEEEHVKNGIITDKFRKDVKEELDDIKSRTFGILFLQIFKALKLLFGLLPQGRIILILLAAVTLLTATLEGETISLAAVRDAVEKTGLAKFIDDIMAELTTFTTEIADDVEELAFASSDVFASIAIQLDSQISRLERARDDLNTFSIPDEDAALAAMDQVQFDLQEIINVLVGPSNSAANADTLLGPALRALDDQIRTIPTLALRLVRFN